MVAAMRTDYFAPWREHSPDNPELGVAGVTGVTNLKKPNADKGLPGQETATPKDIARCSTCNKPLSAATPATRSEVCRCNRDDSGKCSSYAASGELLHLLHLLHPNNHDSKENGEQPSEDELSNAQEYLEERAAILEYDYGFTRKDAENEAERRLEYVTCGSCVHWAGSSPCGAGLNTSGDPVPNVRARICSFHMPRGEQ
jgi:hypothetical protein